MKIWFIGFEELVRSILPVHLVVVENNHDASICKCIYRCIENLNHAHVPWSNIQKSNSQGNDKKLWSFVVDVYNCSKAE